MNIKMMLNRVFLVLFLFVIGTLSGFGQQAKYIFYFIGDGMGLNHVKLTEMYLAELEGRIGTVPLVFSQFPYASFATTYSLSNAVTDSAAGGTALAVGKKTKNGVVSMNEDGTTSYKSIAYAAKEKGMKVGIATSVSIDHATPAVFYAHQTSRKNYYEIASEIPGTNFDFFAGAGFLSPDRNAEKKKVPSIYTRLEEAGYTVVQGYDGFKVLENKGRKLILTNVDGTSPKSIAYEIDRKNDELSLAQITSVAMESLGNGNQKGFFLMVEGGKIDWCSHANDAATVIREMLSFNDAVKQAYEFYQRHPNETLIVVTADHETGGLGLGNGSSRLKTRFLQHQKVSQSRLSDMITNLRSSKPNASWEEVKEILSANLGLWTAVKVSEKDEKALHKAYTKSFVDHNVETKKTLYANDDKIASLAVSILNDEANLAWSSVKHSAAAVPVFAIGVGADKFSHSMENTDIPKKIAQAAKLDL